MPGMLSSTSILAIDPKGEMARISEWQVPDGKHCHYWDLAGISGLPQARINPVGHLTADNPNLVADAMVFSENFLPRSTSPQGAYFEVRAQQRITGLAVGLAKKNGVLRLGDLYDAIMAICAAGEEWLETAWALHSSGYDVAYNTEAEIAAAHKKPSDGSGSQGIWGEMAKAVAPLADPNLRASVSPPFTHSLDELCRSDYFVQTYCIVPPTSLGTWSPVLRALIVGAFTAKMRRPDAPRLVMIGDEMGLVGAQGFPLWVQLYTVGAGLGIVPVSIFQASAQMDDLDKQGRAKITSSAGLQISFQPRDIVEAERTSRMLGVQTLRYDHDLKQGEAATHRRDLVHGLMNGADPFEITARKRHLDFASTYQSKERRPLYTPDEVLNAPAGDAFLFADGLQYPAVVERRNYWEQRRWAYRYMPNPYHPPTDRVQIQTLFGKRWKRVVREPVPDRWAHLPQYRDGFMNVIKR